MGNNQLEKIRARVNPPPNSGNARIETLEKRCKKNRARVNPPPHFRAMPELKSFSSLDVFPKCKTCFRGPRMVLQAHFKKYIITLGVRFLMYPRRTPSAPRFGKRPLLFRIFFATFPKGSHH